MILEARTGIGGDITRPERAQVNERLHVVFIQPVEPSDVESLELPPYKEWVLTATGLKSDELEVVTPDEFSHLPRLGDVDGIVSGGGPNLSPDGQSRIRNVVEYLQEAERRGIPGLNICLSNNLMVEAYGGRVEPRPEGLNSGVEAIMLTDAGREHPLLRGLPDDEIVIFKSHERMVLKPPSARPGFPVSVLARGMAGRPEIIAYGNAVGLSGHPEMNVPIISKLTLLDRQKLLDPSDQAFGKILDNISQRGPFAEQHGRIIGRNFRNNMVAPYRRARR